MAKNYDNITITTTSTDTFHTFEKTYNFDGIYRRIIGGDTLTTTDRCIIKTEEVSGFNDEAFTVEDGAIEYARIRNLHSSNSVCIRMSNSGSGLIFFEIKGGEVLQFHSQLAFDDDSSVFETDYLAVRTKSSTGGVDIFIGLKEI
jgi:hypothetical protein